MRSEATKSQPMYLLVSTDVQTVAAQHFFRRTPILTCGVDKRKKVQKSNIRASADLKNCGVGIQVLWFICKHNPDSYRKEKKVSVMEPSGERSITSIHHHHCQKHLPWASLCTVIMLCPSHNRALRWPSQHPLILCFRADLQSLASVTLDYYSLCLHGITFNYPEPVF